MVSSPQIIYLYHLKSAKDFGGRSKNYNENLGHANKQSQQIQASTEDNIQPELYQDGKKGSIGILI